MFWVPKLFNFFVSVYREKARKKLCFVSVFFVSFEIVDHGVRVIQCGHLPDGGIVALHEATDALHWAMHPTLHHHIRMAI